MARTRPVTVDDLPAEIVSHAFFYLDVVQLLQVAGVCQRWRDLGLEHPTFWKDMGITDTRAGSFEYLKARISQGRDRPCSLSIIISGTHPLIVPLLLRELLAAIMPRAQALNLSLDPTYDQELFRILDMPAPHLVGFGLHSSIPLSPGIFGGRTTSTLERLRLVGASLPNVLIPTFQDVKVIFVHHRTSHERAIFPPVALEQLRHLKALTFMSTSMDIHIQTPISASILSVLSRLELLEVFCHQSLADSFFRAVPSSCLAAIRAVTASGADRTVEFLGHLRSSLNLAVVRVAALLFICLQDATSGFERTVIDALSNYYAQPGANHNANPIFSDMDLPSRFSAVTLSVSLWPHLIKYLRYFTSVPTLIIEFDCLSERSTGSQPLPAHESLETGWPGLRTLVLQSRTRAGIIYVNEHDVLAFMNLMKAPQCDTLELRGVRVVDDTGVLCERFKSVQCLTERLWPNDRLIVINTEL